MLRSLLLIACVLVTCGLMVARADCGVSYSLWSGDPLGLPRTLLLKSRQALSSMNLTLPMRKRRGFFSTKLKRHARDAA